MWFVDTTFPKPKSKVLLKLCEAFNFSPKLLSVLLKTRPRLLKTRPKNYSRLDLEF